MRRTLVLFAAAIALAAIGTRPQTSFVASANAACMAGDKVDKTTADDAKKKIVGAGFSQVVKLQKGCDNYWHGDATKNGTVQHVLVTPTGQVMPDGGE